MRFNPRSKMSITFSVIAFVALIGSLFATGIVSVQVPAAHAAAATSAHSHIDCSTGIAICTEVFDSDQVFGHYVGHDEPSNLFYSNQPGSGNQNRWQLTLPKDPAPT